MTVIKDSRLYQFATTQRLATAAILAWVFTFTGLIVDLADLGPQSVVIGLYILAYLFGGVDAAIEAVRDLLKGSVNVDLLMVLAALGAAFLGEWLEGAILLSLFSTSNALEYYTMDRTRHAVRALMDLTPPVARVQRNDAYIEIPVEEVEIGDHVMIQPAERIPVDGSVISGRSAVDQAAITGESVPVSVEPGTDVFAGTINGNGALHVEVTKLSTDTTLARIVQLVSDAQNDQSDLQEFAEGFEGKYAVGVIVLSFLVGLIPILMGSDSESTIYRAITLLVVLSPCALVISTPAATLSALTNAARNGILVKGGRAMDLLGTVSSVAFDKTGTLTIGKPMLTDIVTFNQTDPSRLLQQTASVEVLSEHPIAGAVVAAAERDNLDLLPARHAQAVPGHGITAEVDNAQYIIGNQRLMAVNNIPIAENVQEHVGRIGDEGKSTMLVARDGIIVGILAVADILRTGVREAIQELKDLGIKKTVMITGDNARVADAIGSQIGIDHIHADLLPEDKVDVIRHERKSAKVAMIGDGVNDAPALAVADVGIAMGAGGTDAALETADVVLMTNDVSRVSYAIGLSRKTRRIVKQNLTFSLSVIAILATLTMTVGIPLPLGVIGHEGSTIIVIFNGLRLLGYGGGFRRLFRGSKEEPVHTETDYRVVIAS